MAKTFEDINVGVYAYRYLWKLVDFPELEEKTWN